jgi:hypothetical protein
LEDVRVWATAASAVSVYAHAHEHIAVADGEQTYRDAQCPKTEDDGTTLTITGDCTNSEGRQWSGKATVTRHGDDRTLSLAGLNGDDGTLELHKAGDAQYRFEAHFELGGVTTIDYSGSVKGGYGGPTLWNGSGHVVREGVLSPTGQIDTSTLDELVDHEVCSGQPVSGSTTLRSGEHTAVITYDGATDCDSSQNAQLTVDDDDRGAIDGINCSLHAPGRAASALGT